MSPDSFIQLAMQFAYYKQLFFVKKNFLKLESKYLFEEFTTDWYQLMKVHLQDDFDMVELIT